MDLGGPIFTEDSRAVLLREALQATAMVFLFVALSGCNIRALIKTALYMFVSTRVGGYTTHLSIYSLWLVIRNQHRDPYEQTSEDRCDRGFDN